MTERIRDVISENTMCKTAWHTMIYHGIDNLEVKKFGSNE